MRDIKPLLILLLSIGLVSTWVYHLYDKTIYSQRRTEIYIKDSAAVADAIKDSLNKIYTSTINDLDNRLSESRFNADTLRSRLNNKLDEIDILKAEIGGILNKKDFSKKDLGDARQKIGELQQKVEDLNSQKITMEEERQELNIVLGQLSQSVDTLQRNIRRLNKENEELSERINLASTFNASELKLEAVSVKGSGEETTSHAKRTDKLVVSFVIHNRINQFSNTELITVLVQPDGQVMQSTVWDSGTFNTKKGVKKNFTRKIKFDYVKGEQKNLLFSIEPEKYHKGIYTLQLWHNGIMIGQATKKLS